MDAAVGRDDDDAKAVGRRVAVNLANAAFIVAFYGGVHGKIRELGYINLVSGEHAAGLPHKIGNGAANPVARRQLAQHGFIAGQQQVFTLLNQGRNLIHPMYHLGHWAAPLSKIRARSALTLGKRKFIAKYPRNS